MGVAVFRMPPRRAPIRPNGGDEELPPPPSLAQVLATMEANRVRTEQLLEQLAKNTVRQAQCVTLSDFMRAQPPFFANPKEPLNADDWLRTVERKFNALHVPAAERVNFASYLLEGAAGVWWEGFQSIHEPEHVVTWEEFRTAFRDMYIPKAVMDQMRKQFQQLTQGNMDVHAYSREFTRLARYAPRDVTNDEDKQELFRKGMNPQLRYDLMSFQFPTFQALVNQAVTVETAKKELESSKRKEESSKRKVHEDPYASSSAPKKRRVFIPYSAVPRAVEAPRQPTYVPPW